MVLFTTVKTISFLMSLRDFTGIKIQVSGFAVNKFEFFAIIYDFSRGFYKQIQRLSEPKTLNKSALHYSKKTVHHHSRLFVFRLNRKHHYIRINIPSPTSKVIRVAYDV